MNSFILFITFPVPNTRDRKRNATKALHKLNLSKRLLIMRLKEHLIALLELAQAASYVSVKHTEQV